MTVRKRTCEGVVLALAVLCFGRGGPARADYMYSFSADTSSVTGQMGSVDIQFNGLGPGGTDTAMILTFASIGGTLGAATPTGDVTGDLANLPVTLTDDTSFNDLNQDFTFGSSLQFTLTLTTNIDSPGATFTFAMYDGSNNPVDAIGGGNFSAIEIDVDQYGNPESPLTGPGVSGGLQGATAVPEPASAVLFALGGIWLVAYRRLRRHKQLEG